MPTNKEVADKAAEEIKKGPPLEDILKNVPMQLRPFVAGYITAVWTQFWTNIYFIAASAYDQDAEFPLRVKPENATKAVPIQPSDVAKFVQNEIVAGSIDLFSPVDVSYITITIPVVGEVKIPMVGIPPHLRKPGILRGFV
jgi:hypothetical protein